MSEKLQKSQENKAGEAKKFDDDVNDVARAIVLLEQTKDAGQCKIDKTSQEVCKLADNREFNKLKLIAKMTNKLCENFLCKLYGIKFKRADVVGNFELARALPQWNKIIKNLKNVDDFAIKPNKDGNSAKITFKYKDSSSKKLVVYPAEHEGELSQEKQEKLNLAFAEMFLGKIKNPSGKNGSQEEYGGEIPQHMQEKLNLAFAEMFLGKIKNPSEKSTSPIDIKTETKKKPPLPGDYESLSTQSSAYSYLKNLYSNLPDSLLQEVSTPFAEAAKIITKGPYTYKGRIEIVKKMKSAFSIIYKHHPARFYKDDANDAIYTNPEERKAFNEIQSEFQSMKLMHMFASFKSLEK